MEILRRGLVSWVLGVGRLVDEDGSASQVNARSGK